MDDHLTPKHPPRNTTNPWHFRSLRGYTLHIYPVFQTDPRLQNPQESRDTCGFARVDDQKIDSIGIDRTEINSIARNAQGSITVLGVWEGLLYGVGAFS